MSLANTALQSLDKRFEEIVAGAVPEGVVDALEMIDVEEEQSGLRTGRIGFLNGLLHAASSYQAIGQRGERVVKGEEARILFGFTAQRDIVVNPDQLRNIPLGIAHRRNHRLLPVERSILALVVEDAGPGIASEQAGPHRRILLGGCFAALKNARILAVHFLGRVAGLRGESMIHVLDASLNVGDDHRDWALLDRRHQPAHFQLHLLAPGHIPSNMKGADQVPIGGKQGREAGFDVAERVPDRIGPLFRIPLAL